MRQTRFQILCQDGVWRYVFCRSLNSSDRKTGSAVISTETRAKAYVGYGDEAEARDLSYFQQHANGAEVRAEIPTP